MAEKDAVRRSYDALARTYADHRSDDGDGIDVLEEFLDSLTDPARILDAGCGQGRPVLRELDARTAAVGLDVSREQLRLARENAPGAAVLQGDMTDLPFEDDAFDAVVAYWSLIHVPLDEHQAAIDEFVRVLAPGGRVLVCEGTNEWVGVNPDWLDSGVEMQWEIAGAEATREQLRAAGFTVSDIWGVPETLEEDEEDDGEGDDDEEADEDPWTFFAARLDP